MKIYAYMQLAMLAALAFAGVFVWRYFSGNSLLAIGGDLKASPLGVPSRAIDAGISAATGREETLGGWLAELFDPATRAANAMLSSRASILPHNNIDAELRAGTLPANDLDAELRGSAPYVWSPVDTELRGLRL